MRLPVGASLFASVPPPAPLPTMITSYWLFVDMFGSPSGSVPFGEVAVVLARVDASRARKHWGEPSKPPPADLADCYSGAHSRLAVLAHTRTGRARDACVNPD